LTDSSIFVKSINKTRQNDWVKGMVRQTVLPLKIEKTRETIAPQGGLALLGEFLLGTGLLESADRYLPKPGSGAGYKPSEYIFPLILMLQSGGRSLEDLRNIREDEGLREVLPLERIPTAEATRDWLRKMGTIGGLDGLEAVEKELLKLVLDNDKIGEYSLNIDVAGIETEKESAEMTLMGFRGYMPLLGLLSENGLIVADEFRQGNIDLATGNLAFLKKCIKQMPKGKKIKYLRAGSNACQGEVINYCDDKGIGFTIGVALDKKVLYAIDGLRRKDWKPFQNGHIARTFYRRKNKKKPVRLIIIRKPYQKNLFGEEEASLKYKTITSNRIESAKNITKWYNQQGEYIENRIEALKKDFGMERMPCGQFEANAVFFRIGVLSYNIFRLFVLKSLDKSWDQLQVRSVLWRLYQIFRKLQDFQ